MSALGIRLTLSVLTLQGVCAFAALKPMSDTKEWLIRTWETEDGLPENSATAMVQAADGYLWFGTFNGLVRFDGAKFAVFDPANTPQLPHASVVNLHRDRGGKLWVSTYRGLVTWDGKTWQAVDAGQGPTDIVRTFTERRNGDLLITAFNGGVAEYANGRLSKLPSPPGKAGQGYLGHVDEQGQWWVIQEEFVGRWDSGRWVRALPASALGGPVAGAGPARDGGLWLLLGTELRKYRGSNEVQRFTLPETPGGFWSLFEDTRTNVWIATHNRGLCRVGPSGEFGRWTTTNGLSYDGTRFVFEDAERNLWVGTSGGGLMRFKPRRVRSFGPEEGLAERVVNSVSLDAQDGIWIGTYGKGLFRWRAGQISPVSLAEAGSPISYVQSVLTDRAGRTWIGSFAQGLWVMEGGRLRRVPIGEVGGGNVISIFEDSTGRVWMGNGQGVTVCESNRFAIYQKQHGLPNGGVRCFAEDSFKVVWATTLTGVFRFVGGRFVELLHDSKPLADILCLKAGADGTMWLGSQNESLLRWRNGKLDRIAPELGFPIRSVHSMVDDDVGYRWFTSNRGIVRASQRELEAAADGAVSQLHCQVLDKSEGMPGGDCTSGHQPLSARDAHGRLWFATLKGAVMVNPKEFQVNQVAPAIHIEEFSYQLQRKPDTGGKPVRVRLTPPFLQPIRLPPGSHHIEIDYTGVSFSAPEKMRFQTKLEGAGHDWQNVEANRLAHFYEQPPGDYIFRVRGANRDGAWNETGTSLAFGVLPFFWQTGWFRVGVGLAVAGEAALIIALLVQGSRRQRAQTQLRTTQERMEIAAEAAHLGMWLWQIPVNTVWVSEKCRELFAFPKNGDITYEAFLQRVHAEDREAAQHAIRMAMARKAPLRTEYRLLLPDQTLRWIAATGRVDFDPAGKPLRMLGICIDISEQRRAENAARELSGRLIHAQEDERRRIARDLHDDLNQQLALLSIEMDLLGRESSSPQEQRDHRLEQVTARVKGLSSEVHKLSYQLHPAKLDQLGLVAAARSFCRELSQQSGVRVDFLQDKVPRDIPADISLCLYRVIQESLQNVVRHSGAQEARVHLQFEHGHLKLLIADSGKGFDLEIARRTGGLGLISMEERIRFVHGSLVVHSRPGAGTEIKLTIPLAKPTPLS